jgi:TonB family protein
MQRTRFAGLFLTFITFCASALAQEPPATAPAQATPAVERVSPPRHLDFRMPLFPASEREAKNTGHVDITVVVSAEGRLVEIKSTTSEPRNAVFEAATQAAVAKWRFMPGMNQRCAPAQTEVTYRVIFENAYGSDHVRAVPLRSPSPSSASSQTAAPRREMKAPNETEVRRTVRYPQDARRAGAQGSVYLMLNVNPANGAIDSLDVASATATKTGFESSFSEAAIEAVHKFNFTPVPELKAPHKMCVPFIFSLA